MKAFGRVERDPAVYMHMFKAFNPINKTHFLTRSIQREEISTKAAQFIAQSDSLCSLCSILQVCTAVKTSAGFCYVETHVIILNILERSNATYLNLYIVLSIC